MSETAAAAAASNAEGRVRAGVVSLRRSRSVGALVLVLLLLLPIVWPALLVPTRMANFDAYQRLLPRARERHPVTIVAIDEYAVDRYGQWPWSRDRFGELINAINRGQPLAIGLDIVFSEPDRSSPEQMARALPAASPLRAGLLALPQHDAQLAAALINAPVVLGAALHTDAARARRDSATPRTAPAAQQLHGGDPRRHLNVYLGAMRSLPALEAAAAAVAALSSEPEDGVVRRVALLNAVDATIWPTLSLEMLRVAAGATALDVQSDGGGARSIDIAEFKALTDADARMWVHFAPFDPARIVSAGDVLQGRTNPAMLEGKLVLVGFYAHGLLDVISTPLGDRRAGVEAHAEVIENILDRRLLARPRSASIVEAATVVIAALLLLIWLPRMRAQRATLMLLGLIALLLVAGVAAFAYAGWLIDVLNPAIAVAMMGAVTTALTLAESERRRQVLAAELVQQREQQARMEGELAAAQRIQIGLLPQPAIALAGETRVDVAAFLLPARSVGGDLYDFFMLDADRLFVAIGDVSGKGVPASLFMALAKSLTKSSALRDDAELAAVIGRAQREISRDNPEFMFMTLAAFVLDLRDGRGRYVNAGHETPLLIHGAHVQLLEDGGGPPICVLDDFEFVSADFRLQPGDQLLLMTDGVTEALDPAGNLYGRQRFDALLERQTLASQAAPAQQFDTHIAGRTSSAQALVAALHSDVLAFANGCELPDDIALVALTWHGLTAVS